MKLNVAGMKDAKGERFAAIEPGIYPVRITKIEEREASEQAKHPGRPYAAIKATITSGSAEGRPLFFNISIPCDGMKTEETAMCANSWKRLFIACDMDAASDEFDSQDLLGAELSLNVVKKMWQGEEKNEVKDWLPRSMADAAESADSDGPSF